jgi:hypothetical protein
MKRLIFSVALSVIANSAFAWGGYGFEEGFSYDIKKGTPVQRGRLVEYLDWETGDFKYGEVTSIYDHGRTVEVEVYDSETDEFLMLEMGK